MSALTASRVLFLCFLGNEAIVLARTPLEERRRLITPRAMPLPVLLLLVPFFFALKLPSGLGWAAVAVQTAGLTMELAAELQLSRARSFSASVNPPARPQTAGLYRCLENPIYVGILLQVAAWSLWMPLTFVSVTLLVESLRRMVREERRCLAQQGIVHRGMDSFLWN